MDSWSHWKKVVYKSEHEEILFFFALCLFGFIWKDSPSNLSTISESSALPVYSVSCTLPASGLSVKPIEMNSYKMDN